MQAGRGGRRSAEAAEGGSVDCQRLGRRSTPPAVPLSPPEHVEPMDTQLLQPVASDQVLVGPLVRDNQAAVAAAREPAV